MYPHALVEWQEKGHPVSVINLKSIEQPRQSYNTYQEDQVVEAVCRGFPGIHPAKILEIGLFPNILTFHSHT